MPKSLPKIIASILLGIVFLLGGARVVSAAAPVLVTQDAILKGLHCGLTVKAAGVSIGSGKLEDCIPVFTYYAVYIPASWILIGGAYVFDTMLMLSIDSKFVQQDFIDTSWKVVRDFSNMAFIFVLLYTGISTMLGTPGWAKTVRNVVIIALLINFSLFFTKVIIDAGNILAVGIYEAIGQPKTANDTHVVAGKSSLEERDISFRLAEKFEPQSFIRTTEVIPAMEATVVFIISAIVSVFAGYIFFKAALLFIGRLIAFWFLMIISPFAFISITFPKGNKFQGWLDTLVSQAFVAPVFLFLVYLIIQVLNSGILNDLIKDPDSANSAGFTFDKVLMPVIVATLIIMALKFALEFSEKMAGDFGKLGASMAGAAMGIAGGLALGGTALAGRAVGGKLASKAFEGGTMQRWAASEKTGLLGAAQRNLGMRGTMALDTARSASWDARNVGLVSKGIKATGVDVGKAGGKGGYVQGEKDWVKEQKKKAALMEVTKEEEDGVVKKAVAKAEAEKQRLERRALEAGKEKEAKMNEARASREGLALTNATLEAQTAKSEMDASVQAEKDAQKAFDEAKASGSKSIAPFEALKKAGENKAAALDKLKGAEETKDKADKEFIESATAKAASRAEEIEKIANNELKAAEAAVIAAPLNAIKTENERRRGAYAEQVTQGVPTSRVARATGTTLGTENLSEARAKKIAAIRAGKSDEDKNKEEKAKLLKELAEEVKKSGESDH